MASTVANLNVRIGADLSEFNRKMAQATRTLQVTGRRLQSIGRTLTMGLTVPIGVAGAAAVGMAAQFENSFVEVRKTVNATESEFQALEEGIRKMATEIPVSTSRLNEIAAAAGRMGVAQENVLQFTRTIADLGVASDLAGEDAATMLTRIIRNSGAANEDIDRLGSSIVALGNNMGTTESRIARASARFAGIASNAGFATSEILALGGVVTEARRRVEGGATAMQRFIKFMNQAATEGGQDLRNLASVAGMSASEFQSTFEKDAPAALEAFLGGLNNLGEEGKSMSGVLSDMDLNAEILQATLTNLAQNSERVGEATSIANNAWMRNNALVEEAQQFYGTFINQLKLTWNNVKEIGNQFGQVLLPAIKNANAAMQSFLDRAQNMSVEARLQIVELAAKIGIGGPLIFAIGVAMSTFARFFQFVFSRSFALMSLFGLTASAAESFANSGDRLQHVWDKALLGLQRTWIRLRIAIINATMSLNRFMGAPIDHQQKQLAKLGKRYGLISRWIQNINDHLANTTDENQSLLDGAKSLAGKLKNIGKEIAGEFAEMSGFNNFMDSLRKAAKFREWWNDLRQEIEKVQSLLSGDMSMFPDRSSQGDSGDGGKEPGGPGDNLKEMGAVLKSVHGIAMNFANSFGDGLSNIIVGAEKAKEAFKGLGKLLLSSAIQRVLKFILNLGTSALAGGPVSPLVAATGIFSGGGVANTASTPNMGGTANRANRIVLQLDGRTIYETTQREQQRRNA